MIHELKIKPEYFAAVVSGDKTFEIRNNADRNFSVGDTLLLWEWDGGFTGQTVERAVSYITNFEQKPGYVVLGLVNHREHELLEKFHRTGVAIERAISTGSVLADHPLKSRLELLASHHEREMELAAQLSDATRQCGVMADLLREAIGEVPQTQSFPSRCDAALAGKLPDRQDTEWTDAATSPAAADYRELLEQHDQLQSKHKGALDLLQEAHEVMRRIIPPLPQDCANRSDLLDRIEVALAGQFTLPAWYLDGAKDFKSMMLEASTALFHPHIEGVFAVFEQRLALDAQPQGGEQIVKCPHCNAEFQDGSDAAEFIGWHGLCSSCELKGGELCDIVNPSSSPA